MEQPTQTLSIEHAMSRAITLFGVEGRSTIVAACITAVGLEGSEPGALTQPSFLAKAARDLFANVVIAFTPDQQESHT